MDLIDPHMHFETLSLSDIQELSMTGIRAVISPTVWPWRAGVDTNTQVVLINRLLRHETFRAEENNLQLFLGIGVVGTSVPTDVEKFFIQMEEYLKEPRVVAIGEVGLDPRSQTCKDLRRQGEILGIQLKMANDKHLPVIIHTPPDLGQVKIEIKEKYAKREIMEKSLELIHEAGLSPAKVVLDHLDTEEWVKFALENGCYAGISIQSWRGTDPELVASWADNFGPERVLLDSDTAYFSNAISPNHLNVPKTVFYLRKRRVPEKKIERMVYQNPITFYNLPLLKEILII